MSKVFCCAVLGLVLVPGLAGSEGDQPRWTSIVELRVAPEKFKDKWVTLTGFLLFGLNEHQRNAALYVDREQGENMVRDGVGVKVTGQMLKDKEKINNMYVVLTGRVRAVPAGGGGYVVVIEEVKNCGIWSDPSHPRGLMPRGPHDRD